MASSWETMAIVGVGLIGGSIGLAARRGHPGGRVIGIGRSLERLQVAVEHGAVDEVTTDLESGVADADLIIVCAPVESIPDLVQRIVASCPDEALVTDAGSTKQTLIKQVESCLTADQASFIGSHPLAGSEKTGVQHSTVDLFENRTVVVTPTSRSAPAGVARLDAFWTSLGAQVLTMSPAEHDAALAVTSHLPHLIASALAVATPEAQLKLAATGWLDTTRVAAGDAELWRQILLQNQPCLLDSLEEFRKVLDEFEQAIRQRDDAALRNLLASGKQRRDALAN